MSRPAVLALFASGLAACSAAPAATNDTDASSESAASADEEDGSGEDEAGADEVGEDEAGEDEAGGTTDDVSTGGGSDLPGLPDPSAIQGLLDAALPEAPEGVDGIGLVVHDETDERVLELTAGELTTDVRFPVASASKYVSALVFLRLVDEGLLSFEDTPGSVLGDDGTFSSVTLDHLGAFASGLPADSPCQFNPFISLDACAADTLLVESTGDAGTIFQYGSSHMTVMGAMAQAVTGENWDTVFRSRLLAPLGLDDPEIRYVTLPQQQAGMINPLVAGGLVIGIDDYMPLLALLFHRGQRDGEAFIDADLVGRLFENPYAEADIGVSPFEIYGYDYRYSFGSWLMCDGPVEECDVVSSPGAFGFTPWVHDREGEPRYYAVLAMESDGPGGAEFSVNLTHDLMPLIAEYLEG